MCILFSDLHMIRTQLGNHCNHYTHLIQSIDIYKNFNVFFFIKKNFEMKKKSLCKGFPQNSTQLPLQTDSTHYGLRDEEQK